jgi:YggT family protein
MTNSLTLILATLLTFFKIYLAVLLVRITLTWFPSVNWYSQPFYSLSRLADPYLQVFRGVVPPLGGMDISPLLGLYLLQCLIQIVSNVGVGVDVDID